MRRLFYILSLLALLLASSYNMIVSATPQSKDIIIIDKVEHILNKNLIYQLDSVTYTALQKELDFETSSYSGNWRGHVATFAVRDNILFLNSIKTSKVNTDFKGLLDKFSEVKGRVTVQFNASEFNDAGKITDWDVSILRCPESLSEDQKEEIIAEVMRVLRLYDFQTFMRDGTWYWRTTRNSQLNWPLIFN